MKKLISIGMFLILVVSAIAITPPPASTTPPPTAPTTGTSGECTKWDVKEETCSGDIRHYKLCFPTVSGGKWTAYSEDCTEYGVGVSCIAGQCRTDEEVSKAIFYAIGAIAILIFLFRRRRKK